VPAVRLAKDCLDVGIYTDHYDELRRFYVDELGLPYEELLKIGAGVHQHRLGLRGSVLKLNSSRHRLDASPTAFVRLEVHADEQRQLEDPDGTEVVLSPDVEAIAVHWASTDPDRLGQLLAEGFDAAADGERAWRIGTTRLVLHPGGGPVGPMRSRGLRYLTVQVHDVRAEHDHLLSVGWTEAMAPTKLGETACISFVHDPDGSPIEISQRASLTGPLPEL
jgi:catechol 2,3-dioxygenase-like lactoylglutathione lyase family enzyme